MSFLTRSVPGIKSVEKKIINCIPTKVDEAIKEIDKIIDINDSSDCKIYLYDAVLSCMEKQSLKQHTLYLICMLVFHALDSHPKLYSTTKTVTVVRKILHKNMEINEGNYANITLNIVSIFTFLYRSYSYNLCHPSIYLLEPNAEPNEMLEIVIKNTKLSDSCSVIIKMINDDVLCNLCYDANYVIINSIVISRLIDAYDKYASEIKTSHVSQFISNQCAHSQYDELTAVIKIVNHIIYYRDDAYERLENYFLSKNVFDNIIEKLSLEADLKCLNIIINSIQVPRILDYISNYIMKTKEVLTIFHSGLSYDAPYRKHVLSIVASLLSKSYSFIKTVVIGAIVGTNYTAYTTSECLLQSFMSEFKSSLYPLLPINVSEYSSTCQPRITRYGKLMYKHRKQEVPNPRGHSMSLTISQFTKANNKINITVVAFIRAECYHLLSICLIDMKPTHAVRI